MSLKKSMVSYDIDLSTKAKFELNEAYNWYEYRLKGLGTRFLREIDYYLLMLSSDPAIYQIRFEDEIRVAPLKVFPYLIVYWIDREKEKVIVLSIFHSNRNPNSILVR